MRAVQSSGSVPSMSGMHILVGQWQLQTLDTLMNLRMKDSLKDDLGLILQILISGIFISLYHFLAIIVRGQISKDYSKERLPLHPQQRTN